MTAFRAQIMSPPPTPLPAPSPTSQPWTIFSLPLEIRLLIYHSALTTPYPIDIPTSPPPTKTLVPALLRTCKRLHAEAAALLYTANTFVLDTRWPTLRFLQGIRPGNVALLRRIELRVGADYDGGRTVNHIHYTGPLWCEVLKKLGEEARGLGYVCVYLGVGDAGGGRWIGAGRDVSFFRALGGLRPREGGRIELDGFFSEERMAGLESVLGTGVVFWEERGKSNEYLRRLEDYRK